MTKTKGEKEMNNCFTVDNEQWKQPEYKMSFFSHRNIIKKLEFFYTGPGQTK